MGLLSVFLLLGLLCGHTVQADDDGTVPVACNVSTSIALDLEKVGEYQMIFNDSYA